MVCYSDKCKAMCAKVVLGVSVLVGLMGIICIVVGLIARGNIKNEKAVELIKGVNLDFSVFGIVILLLGVVATTIGVLGCCTSKCKNCLFSTLFIILTAVTGLIILIIGALMIGLGSPQMIKEAKKAVCRSENPNAPLDINEAYTNLVNKWVCSDLCPCSAGPDGDWETMWKTYGNGVYKDFNRAKDVNSMDTAARTEYEARGAGAKVTPMVFSSAESTDEKPLYNSWMECYFGLDGRKGEDGPLKKLIDENPNEDGF